MILEIKGIDTFYGLGHILHGMSLSVAEGEVVALLGRNGAGKTTTLRSVTGLTPPKKGEILYKGRNIAGLDAHVISRSGIALVPETRDIFSYLTVKENLSIARRNDSRQSSRDSCCSNRRASKPVAFATAKLIPLRFRSGGTPGIGRG